jgi:hypothetical protein
MPWTTALRFNFARIHDPLRELRLDALNLPLRVRYPGVVSEFFKGGGRKPGSKAAASLAKQQQDQKGLPYET